MRRFALLIVLAAPLGLSACGDFGDFLANTGTYGTNPNAPLGNSATMRRARGLDTPIDPLLPEPGNVWPGPVQLQQPPTLQDLERNPNQTLGGPVSEGSSGVAAPSSPSTAAAPDHRQPRPARRGSSTPPGSVQPELSPAVPQSVPSFANPPPAAPGSGRVVLPPTGPNGVTSGTNGNLSTFGAPNQGGQGIIVPNGNGTSTLIKPDGSVSTVPNAR